MDRCVFGQTLEIKIRYVLGADVNFAIQNTSQPNAVILLAAHVHRTAHTQRSGFE